MFHFLHRIYVLGWAAVICGGLVWLYPRTGISEPLVDWYAVWKNQPETSVKPVGELSGTVVKVLDGASLTLRASDRQLFNIALLGTVPPVFKPYSADGELAERARARLAELVLSNEVQVTLTWVDSHRRGVGVVHLGKTNVNAAMVQSGLVQFKPEFIKGLALLDQYALVRAERKAREQKLVEGE